MHFGQNHIARNAQNAHSAVYAFWPKIHCAVYAFWPKTHCAQSAQTNQNTSQARNMHLAMSTIGIETTAMVYATFLILCILRAMRTYQFAEMNHGAPGAQFAPGAQQISHLLRFALPWYIYVRCICILRAICTYTAS
jgi:hypothetical protein